MKKKEEDDQIMKEVLMKNVKYLLSFKLNSEDRRYELLLQKLIYTFLEEMEKIYNKDLQQNTYFNMLLNRFNKNTKSIFIPAKEFQYHPLGFLELGGNLSEKTKPYVAAGIKVSENIKEELLRQTYFFYFLQVLKNKDQVIGFPEEVLEEINKVLTEVQAITLAKRNRLYKKEYHAIYPDGTTHDYFLYTKCLASSNLLTVNLVFILEVLLGRKELMQACLEANSEIWKEFDLRYSHLLGNLQYDKSGKKAYTATSIINEILKRIQNAKTMYQKMEYYKVANRFLFELYDYKVTTILNQKNEEKIRGLLDEVKELETYMLYHKDAKLNARMPHIESIKKTKLKIMNYLNQNKEKVEQEYTIYSLDKRKQNVVKSSVQPIHVDNKYVCIHILEVKGIHDRVLIRANFSVMDYSSFTSKIYGNLYLSLKELKHLYSSSDLGVFTKESEVIRAALANRLLNPTIMDIIKSERHNFLGEFIYSPEEDRCIIYKNKSIEAILERVM